ncbi:MAG: translation elongation factor 4 [bacterium]|nr:translation elongation factor 4 [bacterium]
MSDLNHIRNFAIVAHIDHGKSTLADRILELTGAVPKKRMREQMLDTMDLERERGITIKAVAVRIPYIADDGVEYQLNLIDTPGHVDFSYEVSRALAACEGAVLLVDAAQGPQAQTLANLYMALEQDLAIIPALNKIDLPAARPEEIKKEVVNLIGGSEDEVSMVSAKDGRGVIEVINRIIREVPPPKGEPDEPFRAMIFDSHFDTYKGVVVYVRVVDGIIRVGDHIEMMATGRKFEVNEIGVLNPWPMKIEELSAGEVGFIIATIRDVKDAKVGDTVCLAGKSHEVDPLPGYREPKQMVFASFYPVQPEDYERLTDALEKLNLNDWSFTYQKESSAALGFGYRLGFLGVLHMEIIQERLEREYEFELVVTVPTVRYEIAFTDGHVEHIESPAQFPDRTRIDEIREPICNCTIVTPKEYIGAVMELSHKHRAVDQGMEYIGTERVMLKYRIPLMELIIDFNDRLKGCTRGYGSLDYEHVGYEATHLVKVDILVHGEPVDALTFLSDSESAQKKGRDMVVKLRSTIPRHLFDVPIQAAIGGRVVARETIKALRKDVTAKCYGGDITRKRKLLEQQKKGKQKMKQVGSVSIPQEAFLAALRIREEE